MAALSQRRKLVSLAGPGALSLRRIPASVSFRYEAAVLIIR
jgi:hypothetical protein